MLRPWAPHGRRGGPWQRKQKKGLLLGRYSKYSPPPGPLLGNMAQGKALVRLLRWEILFEVSGPGRAAGWR